MYKKKESTPTPQEGNLREETPKSPKGTLRVELRIESSEPEAVRDEVDGIVNNYELGITNYEETPKSPEGTLREEPFEIDISSVARSLGRKIATMIAKGIVQEHYNGDWSKVRFIGLGEELRDLPCPSEGGELGDESFPIVPLRGIAVRTMLSTELEAV